MSQIEISQGLTLLPSNTMSFADRLMIIYCDFRKCVNKNVSPWADRPSLVHNAPSNSSRRGLLIAGAGEYSAGL